MTVAVDPGTSLVHFTLNSEAVEAQCANDATLAGFLRDTRHQTGTKIGCSIGRCGACTVLVDGVAKNACLLLVWQIDGASVATIEGTADDPIAAQIKAAFLEEASFQCGYCAPGFIMALTGLLRAQPSASDEEVLSALEGNLCRCTGYHAIERGALRAAAKVRAAVVE